MNQRGQLIIIIAILISVIMFLLAVAVDAGRLFIDHARTSRIAQATADAGVGLAAERLVELAESRRAETGGSCEPPPHCWLQPEDWDQLNNDEVRNAVKAEALDYAARNGIILSSPEVLGVEVVYDAIVEKELLKVRVSIRRRMTILLVGLLGQNYVELHAKGLSVIESER